MNAIAASIPRRSTVGNVPRYAPAAGDVAIDLSDNTNRWGMPPAAKDAIRRVGGQQSRYPEAYGESLKDAIAAYLGVPPECIVTGCGSDDVIDTAVRAFGEPGSRIAIPDPTFPMVAAFASANALVPVLVPLSSAYSLCASDMLSRSPNLAYVCTPNNPTGTLTSRAAIEALASGVRGLVIVDEAYIEFTDNPSAVDLTFTTPNVLVVRTFSKAFGLAGLRVGYGIAAPDVVRTVERARGPFKVSAVAAAAAVATLGDGLPWVHEHVALAREIRERLAGELRGRGLEPVASNGNFIFVPLADAANRARCMRELGVAVRAYERLPRLTTALADTNGAALRISVGPWDEITRALAALDQVIAS
jgi:histidinol-phosphate aminotransferase